MIPTELMRQVHRLRILTGRVVNEVFAGEYESAFKGRGMEFAEVREYQPGDEVRTIDWNVTARAGAPFVKQFVEERELTVMLVVDLSSSGRFGSVGRLKNELAAEVCAVLAFAATKSNDRVGLLIFTAQVELYIPPRKGIRHVPAGDPRTPSASSRAPPRRTSPAPWTTSPRCSSAGRWYSWYRTSSPRIFTGRCGGSAAAMT